MRVVGAEECTERARARAVCAVRVTAVPVGTAHVETARCGHAQQPFAISSLHSGALRLFRFHLPAAALAVLGRP